MSEQTEKLVQTIRTRLERVRRRLVVATLLEGLLILATSLLTIWAVTAALEVVFWLPIAFRTILAVVVVLGIAGVLLRYVGFPLMKLIRRPSSSDELSAASGIGRSFPDIRDRLVNMIQLVDGARSDSTDDLLDEAVQSLGLTVERVPFEDVVSFDGVRKAAKVIAFPCLAVVLFAGFSSTSFFGATTRLLSPTTTFSRPAPFQLTVFPGDAELIKGDSLDVYIEAAGERMPESVLIEYRNAGEVRNRAAAIVRDSSDRFHYRFQGIRQTMQYRIVQESVETPWYNITVLKRPVVRKLDLHLSYPEYTRLPDQEMASGIGDVSALVGTEISVDVETGGTEIESASIQFSDGLRLKMEEQDGRVVGRFSVTVSQSYEIILTSPDGISNLNPISYRIDAVPDIPPTASLVYPEPSFDLTESGEVLFRVHISDDYGFSSARVYYRLSESRFSDPSTEFSSLLLPIPDRSSLDQEFEFLWNLHSSSTLDPVPGDVIEYFVRVWDNDSWSGYKYTDTDIWRLHFPSLAEQYERLDHAGDEAESSIEDLIEESNQVKDLFNSLKNDLRKKPDADWQDERRLDQLQEQQQNLESAVENLADQIESMTDQMQENGLVDEKTLSMFEELKEVVDEINTPELMDALRNLENAIQNMDLSGVQKSLENFEFNEAMYQKRLERTLELFKEIRVQKDLDEAARRAQDLTDTENHLEEKTAALQAELERADSSSEESEPMPPDSLRTGDESPNPEESDPALDAGERPDERVEKLAREQDEAASEMKALEEKLGDIAERMKELSRAPNEKMQDLQEDTEDLEIPRQMSENAEQIRRQENERAQQGQRSMQKQLQRLQNQLSQMQQNMQGQQLQINTAGLRAVLEDILTLSERQESLRLDVALMDADSRRLRTATQEQSELSEGLVSVADTLQRLARKIPQMTRAVQEHSGNALREMRAAISAATERTVRQATGHQKGAMTHLNELALILSDLLNQMMNGQGAGSGNMSMQQLMEQLQNMGQQQLDINRQIQQLLNDAQGNRLTSDMMERLRQIGGEQDRIRRELKQLSRNRDVRSKVLGDLNRIAEQMQESILEMEQNRVTRRTIQRQQQILTRLLESSRSMQERGKENKRRSRTGTDFDRNSPGELSPREEIDRLRRDLFRALDGGYAPDYELLIRRYFELLQKNSESPGSRQ